MNCFNDKSQYIWRNRGKYSDCGINDCCIFRKKFNIDKKPRSAVVHLVADTAYMLYVNGERVRRTTAFSPDMPVCFEDDIAGRLVAGENVIAVMCLYRGYHTAFSNSYAPMLRFELQLNFSGDRREYIYSDESFKVKENPYYGSLNVRFSDDKGCAEYMDNRCELYDWHTVGYDDSGWENACVIDAEGKYGETRIFDVGGAENKTEARAVVSIGAGTECEDKPYPECVIEEVAGYKVNLVYGLGSECEIKPLDKGSFNYLTLDFGKIITGYLCIELDSYDGDVTDVIFSSEMKADKPVITGIARFISKDADNTFETMFDRNTFRYVTLIMRNHVRTNILRKMSAYTSAGIIGEATDESFVANSCMGEILLAGPGGAKGQDVSWLKYIADSCITAVNPGYTANLLEMFRCSQSGNGFVKPHYPCPYTDSDGRGTLMYILAVCEYVERTGDTGFAARMLNSVICAFDAIASLEENGLVRSFDGLYNILYYGALKGFSQIAGKINEKIISEYLNKKSKKILKAIKKKYRGRNGIYYEPLPDGDEGDKKASCDINAAAVIYICGKRDTKKIFTEVLDYVNKKATEPSPLHSPLFVRAVRKAGRADVAQLMFYEFENDATYFTAMYELKR